MLSTLLCNPLRVTLTIHVAEIVHNCEYLLTVALYCKQFCVSGLRHISNNFGSQVIFSWLVKQSYYWFALYPFYSYLSYALACLGTQLQCHSHGHSNLCWTGCNDSQLAAVQFHHTEHGTGISDLLFWSQTEQSLHLCEKINLVNTATTIMRL